MIEKSIKFHNRNKKMGRFKVRLEYPNPELFFTEKYPPEMAKCLQKWVQDLVKEKNWKNVTVQNKEDVNSYEFSISFGTKTVLVETPDNQGCCLHAQVTDSSFQKMESPMEGDFYYTMLQLYRTFRTTGSPIFDGLDVLKEKKKDSERRRRLRKKVRKQEKKKKI